MNMQVMVMKKKKTPSIEEYLNKINPYSKDIINNLKKSDTSKMQCTIAINFFLPKIVM